MINTLAITDKTAIGLSLLCVVHCLALPLLVVFLPSVIALPLEGEAFHFWMLIVVLPVSAYALTMGCRKHNRYRVVLLGSLGLVILTVATLMGHDMFGETGEKALSVLGALIIALGHFWNYLLCQHQDSCCCPEQNENSAA